MLKFTTICGTGLLVLALVVITVLIVRYAQTHRPEIAGFIARFSGLQTTVAPVHVTPQPLSELLPTDELPADATAGDKLDVIKPRQTVDVVGQDHELSVVAKVTLTPLWQAAGSKVWTPKPRASPCTAVQLAGGKWMFKVPAREQGPPRWLQGTVISGADPTDFFKGTNENPGPAREFRMNKQTRPVHFTLPENWTPGVRWKTVDLGAFSVECDGRTDEMTTGDRLYSVTAEEVDGGHWLLFLDARQGEAAGTGGLFFCNEFEPDAEVKSIL